MEDVKVSFQITDRLADRILSGIEKQAMSRFHEEVHYLECMAASSRRYRNRL